MPMARLAPAGVRAAERRQEMLEVMLGRQIGGQRMPATPLEGLTQAGGSIAMALMAKRGQQNVDDAQARQSQAMVDAMTQARTAGAGGSPQQGGGQDAMIDALLRDPSTADLGQQMMMKQFESQFGEPARPLVVEGKVLSPDGRTVIGDYSTPKPPPSRNRVAGSQEITEEFDPTTGGWKQVGAGPRWAPQQGPAPDRTLVEIYDANSPTGTRMVPRDQAAGQPGKPPSGGFEVTTDESGRITGVRTGGGGKPPAGYRKTPDGNLESIPGGPADKISAEAQGKASLLPGALEDLASVRQMVENPDGSINRGTITAGSAPMGGVPFTQGRDLNSKILSTADTILRIRTGAAAPASEVESFAQSYRPSALDSDDTIKGKMDRLERDLKNAQQEYTRGTSRDPGRGAADTGDIKGPPAIGDLRQGYRFKGGDPADPSSWEKTGG